MGGLELRASPAGDRVSVNIDPISDRYRLWRVGRVAGGWIGLAGVLAAKRGSPRKLGSRDVDVT